MKQGSNMKGRPRGRNNNQANKGRGPSRNQTYDSNGPGVRVRGNAHQVVEKYQALARDASAQGDRVLCENYLQHAEHYYRIILAINANNPQRVNHLDQSHALNYETDELLEGSDEATVEQVGRGQDRSNEGDDASEEGDNRSFGQERGQQDRNGQDRDQEQGNQQRGRHRRSRSARARDAAEAEAADRRDGREDRPAPEARSSDEGQQAEASGDGAGGGQSAATVHELADDKPRKTVRRRRSSKASGDTDEPEKEAATA